MPNVSIWFDDGTLDAIERAVEEDITYSNRSHLVQMAVTELLEEEGWMGGSEFEPSR